MTTPGGQLTPGDDTTPPVYGVPDGAYVGDAGSPNAITDLNDLTEAEAKRRMQAPINPSYIAQLDGFWGALNALLGLVQAGVDLVVGVVDAVVGGIQSIINSIGSLFGMSHQDTARVDQARVDAENAIVDSMSDSVQFVDQVQRVGGAYMGYNTFRFDNGETLPHVVPLSEPVPLAAGTGWIPPHTPLTHSTEYRYPGVTAAQRINTREILARGSGQLELQESGLWIIDFQASVLQGTGYTSQPVDLWCHVTPADDPWIPMGPPEVNTTSGSSQGDPVPGLQSASRRDTGVADYVPVSLVAAYGRASGYVGVRDSGFAGGNSISGTVVASLSSGAWKVTLSCNSWEKAGGAMSTYVYATKINSETLQQQIDALKVSFEQALPGLPVPLDLDEAAIQAMVGQADSLEAPPVQVPPMEDPGD